MLQVTYNIYERKNKETSSANTLTQITAVYTGKETILLVDKLFTGFYSNYYLIYPVIEYNMSYIKKQAYSYLIQLYMMASKIPQPR